MSRKVFLLADLHFCFPRSSVGKESASNAGDPGSIPGSGRSPGEGNGNPLQYSCLENPMDWGTWQATVHGVTGVRHDLVNKSPPQEMYSQSKLKQLTERLASPPLKLMLLVSCGFSSREHVLIRSFPCFGRRVLDKFTQRINNPEIYVKPQRTPKWPKSSWEKRTKLEVSHSLASDYTTKL